MVGGMSLRKGFRELIDEAMAKIKTLSVEEAYQRFGASSAVFVDIRDIRELERDGLIPGAFHAPRGMLEFWVDPDSPYHKKIFGSGRDFVLYCQSAWRSSLSAATLQEMGFANVSHLEGGFKAWKDAGFPVATAEKDSSHQAGSGS